MSNCNLAGAVVGLDLIVADGSLQSFTPETHPEIFQALVISLGTLGVMYALTLRVEPSFSVTQYAFSHLNRIQLSASFEALMGCAYSVSYFTAWRVDGVGDLLLVKDRYNEIQACSSSSSRGKDDTGTDSSDIAVSETGKGNNVFTLCADVNSIAMSTEQQHVVQGMDPQCCTEQRGVPGAWLDRLPHFKLVIVLIYNYTWLFII